jgi:hypothetical protein
MKRSKTVKLITPAMMAIGLIASLTGYLFEKDWVLWTGIILSMFSLLIETQVWIDEK